jgi:hypothetical protein
MAEWLKAHAWKACIRETVSWVRIPLPPPRPKGPFRGRHWRLAMLNIRKHRFEDYARLPNIDAAGVGDLDQSDLACLDEVGDNLVAAGRHERLGLTLLHNHFPVGDDETLVEEIDIVEKVLTLRPKRNSAQRLTATSVCFESTDNQRADQLIGLEYAEITVLSGVKPFDATDREIITQIGRIILNHGKIRRFGIRLLHDPLNVADCILLETSDVTNRILTSRPMTVDEVALRESIPTVFSWRLLGEHGEADQVITQTCMQMCKASIRCNLGRSPQSR